MEHSYCNVVVAKSGDRVHPTIGLWDVSLLTHVKRAIEYNQLKMMYFIQNNNLTEVVWNREIDPFFNINTAEDLKKAEKLVKKGQLSKEHDVPYP